MNDPAALAVSIKFESCTLFRNVRPVRDILDDFDANSIPYVRIDPAVAKYGSWQVVIAFSDRNNYEEYTNGGLTLKDLVGTWQTAATEGVRSVNPLKAAKRAAAKKK